MTPDGRLWAADSGVANLFSGAALTCPAKIVVYNIRDGEEGRRDKETLVLPQTTAPTKGPTKVLFRHMVVDCQVCALNENGFFARSTSFYSSSKEPPACFLYLSDVSGGAIVVVDFSSGVSRRVASLPATAATSRPVAVAVAKRKGRRGVKTEEVMIRSGVCGMALETDRHPERGRKREGEVRSKCTNPIAFAGDNPFHLFLRLLTDCACARIFFDSLPPLFLPFHSPFCAQKFRSSSLYFLSLFPLLLPLFPREQH